MKLLLLDTSGATASIALAGASTILGTESLPNRTAAERLISAIRSLLAAHQTPLQSLAAIVVVHGPGSFTGVRVGLAAAKGLAEAANLPLIAISRLAVLAELAPPTNSPVHAFLDAGRSEFYHGKYLDGVCLRESLQTLDQAMGVLTPAAPTWQAPTQFVIVCEPAIAQSLAPLHPQLVSEPTAAQALPIALRRLHQKQFDDPVTLDANYVRRTDAEIFAKPTQPQRSSTPIPEPPPTA
jgi:tRNA threonylcarbamoyladenosine biosynthesis protein TsaB